MEKANVGDVVILKSGGPKMTVTHIIGGHTEPQYRMLDHVCLVKGCQNGDVVCEWFNGSERKQDCFKIATLEEVPKE